MSERGERVWARRKVIFSVIFAVIGESDDIYNQTVLGLNRGNNYDGASVLILGGGDGGLLNLLTSLPKPPRHVLMAEVSFRHSLVLSDLLCHLRSGDIFTSLKVLSTLL